MQYKYTQLFSVLTIYFKTIWNIVASVTEITAEKKRVANLNDNEELSQNKTTETELLLEKIAMLSNSLGSQQESVELFQELGLIFNKFSKDRLESILPPATVEIQKGRPKSISSS